MEKGSSVLRGGGAAALAAAVILVTLATVSGEGDPEAMALGMLPAIVLLAPFAMLAPGPRRDRFYRWGMGMALGATLILFFGIGATSFMGTDDQHPADLMYVLVPLVGVIGAVAGRFQAPGMARASLAMALALLLVPSLAVAAGLNLVPISVGEIVFFTVLQNGPFAVLFAGSAWLFRRAAGTGPRPGLGLAAGQAE